MVRAARKSGAADRRCVFEVFARALPGRRRYGVVAGLGRLLELIPSFGFDDAAIAFLSDTEVVDDATAEWLASYRFRGSIDAYREGEVYVPGSPVLVVEGRFAECVVLETLILSVLNHDTAVATAAARMICAAGDRPCIEMGGRRTHEEAAIAAARAAYLAGFACTSNLAAGARYGIPTAGTAGHAFTLVHADEASAFRAQLDALGIGTTLLVDTYDVEQGIRTAIDVAGRYLGSIRLDSGDLPAQAQRARQLLDELGAPHARIVVTSDLDEFAIDRLTAAPVDAYGVGTSVVTGSGAPTAGFVYKLVAREFDKEWQSVQKTSEGKHSIGGRKWAARRLAGGSAVGEVLSVGQPISPRDGLRLLLDNYVRDGDVVNSPTLDEARAHCRRAIAELPDDAMSLTPGDPVFSAVRV